MAELDSSNVPVSFDLYDCFTKKDPFKDQRKTVIT